MSRDTITPSHAELLAKLADQPSEPEDAIAKVAPKYGRSRESPARSTIENVRDDFREVRIGP